MNPRDLLQNLRDGHEISPSAIGDFAKQLGQGAISDAQAGAFAMGVCHRGLGQDGRVALTLAMRDSGKVLHWDLPAPVVDKHSTGGVGDAVSLLLAPMLACCGVYVPMISGRGLGHTGGTLDKLQAIPSLRTEFELDNFQRIVADIGCAIVAPTPDIAPADKRLYAIRDVTGTVRSVDLITASILSKKLAAGLQGLVLDIKCGSGAVMQDAAQAKELAQILVQTANNAGCPTTGIITDMNQPVLPSCGNAVEITDVMRAFETGQGRIVDIALALGADVLQRSRVYYTAKGALEALQKTLSDGSAQDKFGKMVAAQGGPRNFAERWQDYLPIAATQPVVAQKSGYITAIDGQILGHIVVHLGGGRLNEADKINPAVGLSDIVPLGDYVEKGQPLAIIHTNDADAAAQADAALQQAISISDAHTPPPDLIHEVLTA